MRFLGCDHIETAIATADGKTVGRVVCDMGDFFKGCLDRWTQVAGQKWQELPAASMPFLDEDSLLWVDHLVITLLQFAVNVDVLNVKAG